MKSLHKIPNFVLELQTTSLYLYGCFDCTYSMAEEIVGGHAESAMAMMKFLLDQGVDPNCSFNGSQTEWRLILEDLIRLSEEDEGRRMLPRSFEVIKLLLRSGADFEQQCATGVSKLDKDQKPREVTIAASELLRKWYDIDQFGVLEDIVKRRDRKGKKKHGIQRSLAILSVDGFQEVSESPWVGRFGVLVGGVTCDTESRNSSFGDKCAVL